MQLYVLILNKIERMTPLIHELMDAGIHGATVYDSMGVVQYVGHDMTEPPAIFGSLRRYLHPDNGTNKTLVILLEDSQVDSVRSIVNRVTGGLDRPDVGIAFTVPVSSVDGYVKKKA